VGKAIDAYAEQLRRNGVRERSIDTTCYRLRKLFEPVLLVPLATVMPAQARELFAKVEGSVDSRRNILNQARTFCRRAKETSGLTRSFSPTSKAKEEALRETEAYRRRESKFLAACLDLAASANPKKQTGGVGAAMALVFGMRASEITSLRVRDLDAGGTIIRITHAKSKRESEPYKFPSGFGRTTAACRGEGTHETLVGHDRTWLHRNVRAICRKAGITEHHLTACVEPTPTLLSWRRRRRSR